MRNKETWSFEDFIEQIFALSAINEVPGIAEARKALLVEVWQKFPAECKALGLTDGVK